MISLVTLALLLSACAGIEPGSVSVSQPGGVGPVRLQATLCTGTTGAEGCGHGRAEGEGQITVALSVPEGTVMPAAIAATPSSGAAAPTVLHRNAELSQKMGERLPPAEGDEVVAYRSEVIGESDAEEYTWAIEPSMGLPAGEGGGPFAGPFTARTTWAWQLVDEEHPADRPLACDEAETAEHGPSEVCVGTFKEAESVETATSDLVIDPSTTAVAAGATVTLEFGLEFASSAETLPDFDLTTVSTLPGAIPTISSDVFDPGPLDGEGDAEPASRTVTLTVPAGTSPGLYDVTLTATTEEGGAVTGTAQLRVTADASGAVATTDGTGGSSANPASSAPRKVRVKMPRRIGVRALWRKGIPVRITVPEVGSKVAVRLEGVRPGAGATVLLARRWTAGKAGELRLRLRPPRSKAERAAAAGDRLRARFTIVAPGARRRTLVRKMALTGLHES